MGILISIFIFWVGFLLGFFVKSYITNRFRDYSGTIVVSRDNVREKTVYSLVLDDYPEKLEFKKMVIFKIDASEEESNRD
jgi:hypothetical protein